MNSPPSPRRSWAARVCSAALDRVPRNGTGHNHDPDDPGGLVFVNVDIYIQPIVLGGIIFFAVFVDPSATSNSRSSEGAILCGCRTCKKAGLGAHDAAGSQ